jgi:fructosamine-3-kinase
LNDQSGEPVIFDPAVYFGHREMDIAMSHLFGGFHKRFYQAYHEAYPLQKGWEERLGICNLYPLLVHVNLFGGAYLSRVKSVVKRFS